MVVLRVYSCVAVVSCVRRCGVYVYVFACGVVELVLGSFISVCCTSDCVVVGMRCCMMGVLLGWVACES